ncbi:DUF6266 family protein [Daejeonella sp.]|uniref:DUF6266 family protein n=1 Tax=Daejeonella sp. TaxID=2805397 RepID=UPI0039830D46
MGKLVGGINGPFIGKVGSVIGSSRNGVPYMKGLYKNRTEVISEKESFNRRKFAAAQLWLKPLLGVVRVGFNGISRTSGGFISAKSHLMRTVLKVEGDKILIEPALVKVSSGDLPMAEGAAVSKTAPGELTFTWNAVPFKTEYGRDQVIMVAYNVEDFKAFYLLPGQFRSSGHDILPINQDLKPGSVLHVYIAFIAADRSRQSDSLYLGQITI